MQTDDVYLDGGSYDVGITGHTGGAEFESLVLTDMAKVTAVDDSDTTTVTLDDVSRTEGENATITASISSAPTDAPLVLTLSNGAAITFGIGDTTATSTPFLVQTDDVYLDGGSYDVGITGHTGGAEFESLVLTDTATVTAVDDSDATTVTLDDVSQTEGESATISASITAAPTDAPLVLTLSNGAAITFGIGDTTATSTPFLVQTDDVYLDGGSYDVSIASHTGGAEFENLVLTDAAKVTAVDDSDPVTVGIVANGNEGEGGVVVSEASAMSFTVSVNQILEPRPDRRPLRRGHGDNLCRRSDSQLHGTAPGR